MKLYTIDNDVFYACRQALRRHATGGNILIATTLLALVVANAPGLSNVYFDVWSQPVKLQLGGYDLFSHSGVTMTVQGFINDALMAVFFFSIGLEIKREVLVGELSSLRQALLPIVAAVGGMIVPVIIFSLLSAGTDYVGGAAIPMATDIAFSLGVLSLLGRRVPVSLKVFLTTLAVVDDLGGIIVIATCYSSHLQPVLLVYSFALLGVLLLGSLLSIKSKIFYLGIGAVVWLLFLNSGIHPTIAGVLVAFCVPATPVFAPKKYVKIIRASIANFRQEHDKDLNRKSILTKQEMNWLKQIESASDKAISPLQDLEDSLHPVVNDFIIPLFAFANAGIVLSGITPISIVEGVSLAVILGLVVGKFSGILLFSWLTVRLGLAELPHGTNWRILASVAVLGGIGFTVSIFIANLSFPANHSLLEHAKLGIVVGSILSGILGYWLLKFSLNKISDK